MKQQKKYREELQNRTITPSSDAWEKLSKKLAENEVVHKKNNKWVFLKYAASILLIASASLFFFQPKEEIINAPIIVEPTLKKEVKFIPEVKEASAQKNVAETKIIPKKTQNKKPTKKSKIDFEITEEAIAIANITETLINETIIQEIPENTSTTSKELDLDIEVENLLKNAKTNQILKRPKVISANELLTAVEDDLDKDFKDKLIDNIINTLKKPRVVITDRDN